MSFVLVITCAGVFLGIGKLNSYSPVNFNDVEYSEDGKKPYNTHIQHEMGKTYTIQTKDLYDNGIYVDATKKGNEFVVDDDISDYYQDWVTGVKFKVTNMGQNIQEFDYVKHSEKPHKEKIQRLIRNLD